MNAALFMLSLSINEPQLNYRCLDTIKLDLVSAIIDWT